MALFSAEVGTSDACAVHVTVTRSTPSPAAVIVAGEREPDAADASPAPGAVQNAHTGTVEAARTNASPTKIFRA
jgi:hypothetical protein